MRTKYDNFGHTRFVIWSWIIPWVKWSPYEQVEIEELDKIIEIYTKAFPYENDSPIAQRYLAFGSDAKERPAQSLFELEKIRDKLLGPNGIKTPEAPSGEVVDDARGLISIIIHFLRSWQNEWSLKQAYADDPASLLCYQLVAHIEKIWGQTITENTVEELQKLQSVIKDLNNCNESNGVIPHRLVRKLLSDLDTLLDKAIKNTKIKAARLSLNNRLERLVTNGKNVVQQALPYFLLAMRNTKATDQCDLLATAYSNPDGLPNELQEMLTQTTTGRWLGNLIFAPQLKNLFLTVDDQKISVLEHKLKSSLKNKNINLNYFLEENTTNPKKEILSEVQQIQALDLSTKALGIAAEFINDRDKDDKGNQAFDKVKNSFIKLHGLLQNYSQTLIFLYRSCKLLDYLGVRCIQGSSKQSASDESIREEFEWLIKNYKEVSEAIKVELEVISEFSTKHTTKALTSHAETDGLSWFHNTTTAQIKLKTQIEPTLEKNDKTIIEIENLIHTYQCSPTKTANETTIFKADVAQFKEKDSGLGSTANSNKELTTTSNNITANQESKVLPLKQAAPSAKVERVSELQLPKTATSKSTITREHILDYSWYANKLEKITTGFLYNFRNFHSNKLTSSEIFGLIKEVHEAADCKGVFKNPKTAIISYLLRPRHWWQIFSGKRFTDSIEEQQQRELYYLNCEIVNEQLINNESFCQVVAETVVKAVSNCNNMKEKVLTLLKNKECLKILGDKQFETHVIKPTLTYLSDLLVSRATLGIDELVPRLQNALDILFDKNFLEWLVRYKDHSDHDIITVTNICCEVIAQAHVVIANSGQLQCTERLYDTIHNPPNDLLFQTLGEKLNQKISKMMSLHPSAKSEHAIAGQLQPSASAHGQATTAQQPIHDNHQEGKALTESAAPTTNLAQDVVTPQSNLSKTGS